MAFKVRYNKRSVTVKIDKLLELAEEEAKDELKSIATQLADQTLNFTDTGAYAESFSVTDGGSRSARIVSSSNRPTEQPRGPFRDKARSQMFADIENLTVLEEGSRPIFKNNAPHAPAVEKKHTVFQIVRNNNR